MSIKDDLVSTKANFISFNELIETLAEMEGIAKIDVVGWLLNADSERAVPPTYVCALFQGRLSFYKEECFHDFCHDYGADSPQFDMGYSDDELGFLRPEIIHYLRDMGVNYPQENSEVALPQFMVKSELTLPLELIPHDSLEVKFELGRREYQHEIILAIIAALDFDPLQIPDGGKAKIKTACLTRPRIFTKASFDHAWKDGLRDGLFRLASHDKYSRQIEQ